MTGGQIISKKQKSEQQQTHENMPALWEQMLWLERSGASYAPSPLVFPSIARATFHSGSAILSLLCLGSQWLSLCDVHGCRGLLLPVSTSFIFIFVLGIAFFHLSSEHCWETRSLSTHTLGGLCRTAWAPLLLALQWHQHKTKGLGPMFSSKAGKSRDLLASHLPSSLKSPPSPVVPL